MDIHALLDGKVFTGTYYLAEALNSIADEDSVHLVICQVNKILATKNLLASPSFNVSVKKRGKRVLIQIAVRVKDELLDVLEFIHKDQQLCELQRSSTVASIKFGFGLDKIDQYFRPSVIDLADEETEKFVEFINQYRYENSKYPRKYRFTVERSGNQITVSIFNNERFDDSLQLSVR